MSAPFDTYFGLSQRSKNLVEMYRHNQPEVLAYQLWASSQINNIYGNALNSGVGGSGGAAVFTVPRDGFFRSAALRRKGLGMFENNRRGQTTVVVDPEDFIVLGANLPLDIDEKWMFFTAQEQRAAGLLTYDGVPQAEVTLTGVLAGDQITIKGLIFEFAAGANALGGTTGQPANEFIVGLGAGDAAAAANLVLALNDAADVGASLDAEAVLLLHTFAPAAVGTTVTIQPEDGTPALVPGNIGAFAISTSDAGRLALDADSLAAGALVSQPGQPVKGSIYCVPPASFFGMPQPTLALVATAPSGTGAALGALPTFDEDLSNAAPRPMHLVFPRPLTAITITNTSGNDLLVALGAGAPWVNLATLTEMSLFSGSTKEIFVACPDAGGAGFRIHGVCGLG